MASQDLDEAHDDWQSVLSQYKKPSALERALLAAGGVVGAGVGDAAAREGAGFLAKATPIAKRLKGAGLGALAGAGLAHLANAIATPEKRERTVTNHKLIRDYKKRQPGMFSSDGSAFGTISRASMAREKQKAAPVTAPTATRYDGDVAPMTGGSASNAYYPPGLDWDGMSMELGVDPETLRHVWRGYKGDTMDIADDLGIDHMYLERAMRSHSPRYLR